MNTTRRVIAVVAALGLAGGLAPTAQATPPDDVVRLLINCPTADAVSTLIGEDTTFSVGWPDLDCVYSTVDDGSIYFTLWDYPIEKTRRWGELPPSANSAGRPVTDVAGWGPGAAQVEVDGTWYVTYPLQEVSATLGVPLMFKKDAPALAALHAKGTFPRPVPTVAPKAFTAVCPSAKDVGRIIGQTMKPRAVDVPNTCDYIGNEHIQLSISDTYGSVAEARIDVDLDFKNSIVIVGDFDGLGKGAFYWTDASPAFITWQLQDGVVAHMYGASGDEARSLARLFKDAQTKGNGKPSKPGLPTTGN
ncbi:MAG: hypothetical protein Q4P15_13025 [Propionibacteriaceae bacterium]|nr:hypothetical protein [Propionibacteriaceae bacterium]